MLTDRKYHRVEARHAGKVCQRFDMVIQPIHFLIPETREERRLLLFVSETKHTHIPVHIHIHSVRERRIANS